MVSEKHNCAEDVLGNNFSMVYRIKLLETIMIEKQIESKEIFEFIATFSFSEVLYL